MLKYLPLLKENHILKNVATDDLIDLLKQAKQLELRKRTIVYLEGSTDDNIYLLVKGAIKGFSISKQKNALWLLLTEGSFFGNFDYIFNESPSNISMECVSACIILSFPRKYLFERLSRKPNYWINIINILNVFLNSYKERIAMLTLTANASESYSLFNKKFGKYATYFANKDIAAYLGISPEALTRIKKETKRLPTFHSQQNPNQYLA